jgi:hypothetical protein
MSTAKQSKVLPVHIYEALRHEDAYRSGGITPPFFTTVLDDEE